MRTPSRHTVLFAVLIIVATALAGCGKSQPNVTLNDVERAIRETPGKVLHGRVMTDEILPLQGTVELMEESSNATTAEDGLFLFAGLESRDYFVLATSPGYYPEVQRAAMMLGRDFKLDFYLTKIPTGDPHHSTQVFEAFISCQAVIIMDFPGRMYQDCGAADPNNKRTHMFTFNKHSNGFIVEVDWEPTTACAATLDLGLYLRLDNGANHALIEEYVTPGTKIFVPPAYFAPNGKTGGNVGATLVADKCNGLGEGGLGAGLVVQQPVDVFFTAFYYEDIPADFSVKNG